MLAALVGFLIGDAIGEVIRPKAGPGECARCRKAPMAVTVAGAGEQRVCEKCAYRVDRNHRAGELFFFGFAVLMGVLGVFLVGLHLHRGWPVSLSDALLYIVAVALPAGAAAAIRAARRTPQNSRQ
jgi:hypothetical protein